MMRRWISKLWIIPLFLFQSPELLAHVRLPESPLLTASFEYDGLGNLLQIHETGAIRRLVRDRADELTRPLVLTDASGAAVQTYVWANGSLIAQIETGAVRYAHFNELGHLLALTDESGDVTDEFAYHPYGRLVAHIGTTETPFAYMGAYGVMRVGYDLYLTRHRAYSANLMRFLQADPMGLDGGWNLYAYADGNPVVGVDPTGLLTIFVHGTYSDRSTFGQSARDIYAETFNDHNQASFDWSGMNNTLARKLAGRQLAGNINEYRSQNPNEPITIVSHSHGGNVAIEASHRAAIDNLVTLGTPARTFTHKPNESNIGEWYNVYSHGDKVQVSGGGLFQPLFQEVGPAGRTFNNAHNIEVQHSSGWIQTHGDLTGSVGANAVENYINRPAK